MKTKEQFLKLVQVTSSCWLWKGTKWIPGADRLVYGKARYRNKLIKAHRLAYLLWKGPIKRGKVIRHSCDVPLCVNPEHLKEGTVTENTMDAIRRGRLHYPPKNFFASDDPRDMLAPDTEGCEGEAQDPTTEAA